MVFKNLSEFGFKGNIKSISIFKLSQLTKIESYNMEGMLIEEILYADGVIQSKEFIEIYDYEILVFQDIYQNGQFEQRTLSRRYDKKERLTFDGYRTNTYVDEPSGYKMSEFDLDGNLLETTIHKLDSDGRLIEEIHYNADDTFKNSYKWEYDDQNRLTAWQNSHQFDSPLYENIVYAYDDNGNVTNKWNCWGSVEQDSFCYEYDDKNNITFWSATDHNWGDYSEFYYRYKYDDKGIIIEKLEYYDRTGKPFLWKIYNRDVHGNLIKYTKKGISFKKEVNEVTEFELVYFY